LTKKRIKDNAMGKEYIEYPEIFKRKLVNQIESGEIGVEEARRKYFIGGKMTISKWRKKYGSCQCQIIRTNDYMSKNKPDNSVEGRLAEAERELALYKRLIEVSEYFKDPVVKKKIAERLSAYYGKNSEELERLNIPWLKSVLYTVSADKPITNIAQDK
jgi:transposase-like protein